MEPDSRLSDLSADERLEVCMLLLDEWQSRRQGTLAEEGPGKARPGRHMLVNILRKLDPSAELIREMAGDLHVDLALILERVGYAHGDE